MDSRTVTFSLRLPGKIYDRLVAEAKQGTRNQTQQIIHILRERYEEADDGD